MSKLDALIEKYKKRLERIHKFGYTDIDELGDKGYELVKAIYQNTIWDLQELREDRGEG